MDCTGLKIYKESYDVLMDKSISQETKEKVLSIIDEHDEVIKIQHFNATPVGYRYQVSFSIFVDGNLSTFDSHEIANNLEKEIGKKVPEIYLTVIHVNPMKIDKKKDYVITMEIEGKELSSTGFAQKIKQLSNEGHAEIAFIIGGANGLHQDIKNISNFKLSMSKMTFLHEFARLLLVEQIYRAFKIMKKESYHK